MEIITVTTVAMENMENMANGTRNFQRKMMNREVLGDTTRADMAEDSMRWVESQWKVMDTTAIMATTNPATIAPINTVNMENMVNMDTMVTTQDLLLTSPERSSTFTMQSRPCAALLSSCAPRSWLLLCAERELSGETNPVSPRK